MAINMMMGFLGKKEVGVVRGFGGKSGMYGAWGGHQSNVYMEKIPRRWDSA